ncbi:MAG TPA: F0F1 ATP synthase subunit A [Balneolaceae bacterium]|nr:F0F1 ATP synthase subunit A [Balneolaceae bacterium]
MIQAFRRVFVTALIILAFCPSTQAQHVDTEHAGEQVEEKNSPIDVMGQVRNHNSIEIAGFDIPLPRILLVEGKWYVFGSNEAAVESGNFVLEQHTLVPANGSEITLDLSITSHLIFFWIAFGITVLLSLAMARKYKRGTGRETEPQGWFQNMFEVTFMFIRDIAKNNIPVNKYHKFVPYLFTVFVAILLMNLFGLFPWGATATADVTVTALLALFTFVLTQWNGTKDHWKHVFWYPGVPAWAKIILTPVEFIGLFTKPFALCIRLFANMLSGKIMIICFLGLIFIFANLFGAIAGWTTSLLAVPLTVGIYILKAFVALIQAYIFTLLSAVFIGMAAEEAEKTEIEQGPAGVEAKVNHA